MRFAPFALFVLSAALSTTTFAEDLRETQRTALDEVDRRADGLKAVNQSIWSWAEVGLQETKSAKLLESKLEEAGFEIRSGVAGMPTAFVAEYGEGRPIIGILAEYDALPGLSQKVGPVREPVVPEGAGHACGHSGLGTGALGAALAVKQAMQEHGIEGTLRLYGTPAEETCLGKTYMLLADEFKDLDTCLHWHPSTKNQPWAGSSKAIVSVKFTFHGTSSHASVSPESGRSALDGVELMNVGVNFMREHLKEDARLHYVVIDGGGQPNVVPAKATVWYYCRADRHEDVEYQYAWLNDIAEGAAKMSRTKLTVQIDTDNHELIPNTPLSELVHANLEKVGPPKFTSDEQNLALRLQAPLIEEFGSSFPVAIDETIHSVAASSEPSKGSTDVGDISWFVPTGGLRTTCFAANSPGHSWQNVAAIGSSIGEKGTLYAAKVLALTALDLYEQPAHLAAAKADFASRMQDRKYTTLIPEGQPAPKAIR
jgi:aminobenzoyl-glutamate utilization protein B